MHGTKKAVAYITQLQYHPPTAGTILTPFLTNLGTVATVLRTVYCYTWESDSNAVRNKPPVPKPTTVRICPGECSKRLTRIHFGVSCDTAIALFCTASANDYTLRS
jgi:hypothetical protein